MGGTAVIIVTYIMTDFQKELLEKSIQAVLKFHPSDTLVVLNDNHSFSMKEFQEKFQSVQFEKTKYPKSGEVNAYTWSCENMHRFSRFLFLHDSAILINKIPIELTSQVHFKPLWYAIPHYASIGLMTLEVENVIKDIQIGPTTGPSLYNIILNRYIFVVFGCMGMWDTTFCKFIMENTNIIQNAGRFNTRNLRCLFERIVHLCYAYSHTDIPFRNFTSMSLCGDIMVHGSAFANKEFNPEIANNQYVLKVWQGR